MSIDLWHSKYSPFAHRNYFVGMPVCDPHRVSMWTQNRAAVLAFIGGCDIEFQTEDGKWHPLRMSQFASQ